MERKAREARKASFTTCVFAVLACSAFKRRHHRH
jgi:hypothetical protein